jgi:hypothetical protein
MKIQELPSDEQIEYLFRNDNPQFHKLANYYKTSFYKDDQQIFKEKFQKYYGFQQQKIDKTSPGMWIGTTYATQKPNMICPHCQTKGEVYTGMGKQKQGISGGKATGALLTGGISLLATGLSRKTTVTFAYCKNCESQWQF